MPARLPDSPSWCTPQAGCLNPARTRPQKPLPRRPTQSVLAPSIRGGRVSGGDELSSLLLASPPVATRNGLTPPHANRRAHPARIFNEKSPGNPGRTYIKNSTHPITQGFSGKVKVYVEPYSLNYGIVSADADVLATIQEDGSFPTLFVYEKGDHLADGSVAPNKRIGLFLGQIASPNANTDPVFANLTADGKNR